ncbi:hypothetical protein MMC12_001562 [Toensbergia leucococca]|nr:hypothetical protein [Toensbergia leucococca]
MKSTPSGPTTVQHNAESYSDLTAHSHSVSSTPRDLGKKTLLSKVDMDPSTLQLQNDLRESISRALKTRRPVLTHLNADTTWVLQLPYPQNTPSPHGRSFYNILIDPWLQGPQTDYASWISRQWHAVDSSVQTIAELNAQLSHVEVFAQPTRDKTKESNLAEYQERLNQSFIDAVIISHEFTDHCNKSTLLELRSDTPMFATTVAAETLRSWKYFTAIQDISAFSLKNRDWRKTSIVPLPPWLGISRILTNSDALYFHSAILIAFKTNETSITISSAEEDVAEAVIYTPHGVNADELSHMPFVMPPIKTLALIHGLHDITINCLKQLNLGAFNGLRAQRLCGARYWVSTHDEIKRGAGLIAPLLRRKMLTLEEAIEREKEAYPGLEDIREVRFRELGSGESLLME